jgi:hypothetical protein
MRMKLNWIWGNGNCGGMDGYGERNMEMNCELAHSHGDLQRQRGDGGRRRMLIQRKNV